MMALELTVMGHELSVRTLSQCIIAVKKTNKTLEINSKTIENKRKKLHYTFCQNPLFTYSLNNGFVSGTCNLKQNKT